MPPQGDHRSAAADPRADQIRLRGGHRVGADFIKTGTGFFGPTTLEIVRMVSDAAAGRIRIKAAGGIMGYETLKAMREMGVSRFGMGYKKVAAMLREL